METTFFIANFPPPTPQKQKEIISELIRYSNAGLVVTRLKGGDPLISGRGGEEIKALAE